MKIKMYGSACAIVHRILIVLPFIAALNVVKVRTAFHFTSFTSPAGPCGRKMSAKHSRRAIGSLSRSVIYTQVAFLFRNKGGCGAHSWTCLFVGFGVLVCVIHTVYA